MLFFWVAVGGLFGSMARYGVAQWVQQLLQHRPAGAFPWATLLINVTGCAAIGALVPWFDRMGTPQELRVAVLIGFLGAYTTWSTFSFETLGLIKFGDLPCAIAYILSTNVGCFLAVWAANHAMSRLLARS
ncbi:MAG: fluoride efflux transporter CrcB [Phycisphaerae bacterium]|nr:fluoride efflux transporter CrcB [Phycisphaerae bacterium]